MSSRTNVSDLIFHGNKISPLSRNANSPQNFEKMLMVGSFYFGSAPGRHIWKVGLPGTGRISKKRKPIAKIAVGAHNEEGVPFLGAERRGNLDRKDCFPSLAMAPSHLWGSTTIFTNPFFWNSPVEPGLGFGSVGFVRLFFSSGVSKIREFFRTTIESMSRDARMHESPLL